MKSTVFAVLLLSTLAGSNPALVATDDDELAGRFFPSELASDVPSDHPTLKADREWKAIRADFDLSGTKSYLVVAYSNGFRGAVSVIKSDADGPVLVPVTGHAFLFDSVMNVETVDLDADGRLEIVAQFYSGRGLPSAWIYRWQGDHLACLNPATPEAHADGETILWNRELREPSFVDIDGDGRLEVLAPSSNFGVDSEQLQEGTADDGADFLADQSYDVFKLGEDLLEETDTPVTYLGYFSRRRGAPVWKREQFLATPGEYLVTIINSDGGGGVAAGEVLVNDQRIVGPNDFKSKARRLTRKVSLGAKNSIWVELRSAPESSMIVVIQKANPS